MIKILKFESDSCPQCKALSATLERITKEYKTDMKSIDDSELEYLKGIDLLVVNALRWEKPHHSHQLVADAIAFSQKIGAKRTYLTHLTHSIGLDKDANKRLPIGVKFGYDGEVLTV